MSVVAVKTAPRVPRPIQEVIAHYIKEPPENSRIFTITPNLAQWILDTYHDKDNNRSKKPQKIKQYAADMVDGKWGKTGDTLKFSDKGLFRDGQNRLFSCIKADTPFQTHVVFGIEDHLFDVMDRGKPRSGNDVLAIDGFKNTAALAAAVRWTRLIATDRVKFRDTYEPKELLAMLKSDYPTLPEFISQARVIARATEMPPGLVAAVIYLAAQRDPRKATDFARIWQLGGTVPHGKPIVHMLRRLQELRTQSQGRVHDVVRAALAIQAWNLFAKKRDGRYGEVAWKLTDAFPQMVG
jgi:hypothetical protein